MDPINRDSLAAHSHKIINSLCRLSLVDNRPKKSIDDCFNKRLISIE
ncbi:hypothetical protein C4K11_2582 [Pseudomonas chlororaphis subsp. aureofaciens]|nr:hypothetical protein C4K11_2582 [Pseudomonas chlororaphis subsp. aureofaciens]